MMTDSKKLAIALKALETIQANEGRLCEIYEICDHVACRSSYTSWALADAALRVIQDQLSLVVWNQLLTDLEVE